MSITSRINEMSSHIEQAYDELQGLGADLTNVNKNIENISMVLDDIYDSLPSVSGEGTSLTLDDTRVGKIKSTLKGNTSQTGTPTPTSPIPVNVVSGDNEINVCGKNLLENQYLPIPSADNTATYEVKNAYLSQGTYTLATTDNSTFGNTVYIKLFKEDKQVVKESGHLSTSNGNYSTNTYNYFIGTANNLTYIQFTIDDNYYARIGLLNSDNTKEVMLVKGTEIVRTYEPYSSNTYNIDLPVENLFDDSTLNNKWVAQNGTITSATGANCIKYNCSANDTYTLSATFGTSNSSNIIVMAFYNSSDTLLNRYIATTNTSLTMTYTAPANTSYMYAGHYGVVPTTIQLEKGSKQNSFTPYGTTPIELCKIGNYQDYFYKDSGKWYLHKEIGKVVLNGTETWVYDSEFNYFRCPSYSFTDLPLEMTSANRASYMQYANNFTLNKAWSGTGSFRDTTDVSMFYPAQNTGYKILLRNVNFTTTSDFSNWLSSNNTLIYYPLANPTNTEITDTNLLNQLNAIEQATSKENITNISQVNNDLPFIISASALKEWTQ